MAVSAPSGNAHHPQAPAPDRGGNAVGRGQGTATRLALPRYRLRNLWALAAAVAGPLAGQVGHACTATWTAR